MTVYVDDMHLYEMGRFGRMKMSHMIADTDDELYEMADAIGVPRKWVQYPDSPSRIHFDICLSKRKLAVDAGAVEVTMRELAQMRR